MAKIYRVRYEFDAEVGRFTRDEIDRGTQGGADEVFFANILYGDDGSADIDLRTFDPDRIPPGGAPNGAALLIVLGAVTQKLVQAEMVGPIGDLCRAMQAAYVSEHKKGLLPCLVVR